MSLPSSVHKPLLASARDIRRLVVQTVHQTKAGHLGGPLSAADLLAVLYFHELRVDPERPDWPDRDRFVLSKGHSALGLYATLALRGFFPVPEMATFDRIDSRLQGHPDLTRLPGLDMSTGSLGQGLSAAVGMALGAKLQGKPFRVFALLGDGECQEGQIWEAAQVAPRYGLDNLIAVLDYNKLQQWGWKQGGKQLPPIEEPAAKWRAFGWHVIETDGHDMQAITEALDAARYSAGKPALIVAHTVKGKGVSFMENDPDWHAKPLNDEQLAQALDDLGGDLLLVPDPALPRHQPVSTRNSPPPALRWEPVRGGTPLAQREVFGKTLIALAEADSRVYVLDGDLGNSTRSDLLEKAQPERALQMGIAEQNMLSVAAGMAAVGLTPWISTFTAFLVKRALDQIRVQVAQTHLPVRLVGSYSGLWTNRTGKSHQSVEDLAVMRAMPGMTVLAPADGVEEAAMMRAMQAFPGPAYMRINRDAVPAIFDERYDFAIGQAVILREGADIALLSTGVQTSRALEAAALLAADGIDAYVLHLPTVKPLAADAVVAAARATGLVLVTEEHTVLGGLGGAVAEVLSERFPVPVRRHGLEDVYAESGSDEDLIDKYGLAPRHIAAAARAWL
ncbi:MAG: transketolase, partial [Candidatus Sericytochromatia bacterium]|nr:transketolase [Candidatus Tanganyikabacteria bacterium]